MNIGHLRCFEAVYQERSINKAAGQLYMSPQGVGKNIQFLESELDTVLFVRTKNGVFPTESAHLVHKKAGQIIKQLEELKYSIAQLNKQNIVLRIGYVCGVFNVLPFKAILKFMEKYPDVQVTWSEYPNVMMHEMLRNSKIEYGFGVGIKRAEDEQDLVFRRIVKKSAMLLVYEGHRLYDQPTASIAQLREEKILTLNENFYIYYDLLDVCSACGFIPKIVAETTDSAALYHLCAQKIGLAVIPEYNCENFSLQGVRALRLTDDFGLVVHSAYKKENENIEVIRLFDSFLKNYL